MFKTIDDRDIQSVEKLISEDLREFFESKTINLPYGSTSEDAFGPIFALNPSKFKFLRGDRNTIKIALDFVNGMETHKDVTEVKPSLKSSIQQAEYVNNDVQLVELS